MTVYKGLYNIQVHTHTPNYVAAYSMPLSTKSVSAFHQLEPATHITTWTRNVQQPGFCHCCSNSLPNPTWNPNVTEAAAFRHLLKTWRDVTICTVSALSTLVSSDDAVYKLSHW